jgi:metal-dependent amidase/aminoacylase/carboxypeptidase family protein
MLVHPTPMPFDAIGEGTLAVALFDVHYTGKASCAGVAPEQGINVADAMTIAQVAIGLLRQQLPSTIRISGIVTDGGEAPNIIPSHTSARYNLRVPTFDELLDLRARVTRCFEAGALATGAHVEIVGRDKPYAHMVQNAAMAELYRRNAETLGRVVQDGPCTSDRWRVHRSMIGRIRRDGCAASWKMRLLTGRYWLAASLAISPPCYCYGQTAGSCCWRPPADCGGPAETRWP